MKSHSTELWQHRKLQLLVSCCVGRRRCFVISVSFTMNVMLCNQYVLDFLLWIESCCLISTHSGIQGEICSGKKINQLEKSFLLAVLFALPRGDWHMHIHQWYSPLFLPGVADVYSLFSLFSCISPINHPTSSVASDPLFFFFLGSIHDHFIKTKEETLSY